MLLHSFGHNKNMWFPQLTYFLERGFRVVAPDMPGHGDSTFDPAHHSVDQIARSYAELLTSIGVRRAIVAGISMGGYVALRMWAHNRDLIGALVLSNTKASAIPTRSSRGGAARSPTYTSTASPSSSAPVRRDGSRRRRSISGPGCSTASR